MSIIPKNNYKLDFVTEAISIPLDPLSLKKFDTDRKEFVVNFVAVLTAQLFEPGTTIIKYDERGFYLDIFYSRDSMGVLFVREPESYTSNELEAVNTLCNIFHIRLTTIYLYTSNPYAMVRSFADNSLEINVSYEDQHSEFYEKLVMLLNELGRMYIPDFERKEQTIRDRLDLAITCKLALLMSVKKRESRFRSTAFELYNYLHRRGKLTEITEAEETE